MERIELVKECQVMRVDFRKENKDKQILYISEDIRLPPVIRLRQYLTLPRISIDYREY